MHRTLLRVAACAFALAAGAATPMLARAADPPVVPLISFFNHWDHHWYVWLRGDPTYEAVEIMSRDRGAGVPPLVWVFFTERGPPKQQVNYINDQRTAAALGLQFRNIAFSTSGPPGESQSLSVALANSQGQPVSIEVERDPDAALSRERGGLTNQIGHSGDRLILLFYREQGALSRAARVTVGGAEVSLPRPGVNFAAPFNVAYSRNILVGGFPFVDRRMTFDAVSAPPPGVPRFACSGGRCVAELPDRTAVELDVVGDGDLWAYRHRDGDHQLAVRFEPALLPAQRLAAGFKAKFVISLDGFGDLVSGDLASTSVPGGVALDWRFEAPDWLGERPMQTTYIAEQGQGGGVEVRVRALK